MDLQKQRSRSAMFIYSTVRSLRSWLLVSLEVWIESQHLCPMHFKGLAVGGYLIQEPPPIFLQDVIMNWNRPEGISLEDKTKD